MIVLSGASLVLPDRILSPGTLVLDHGRIVEIRNDHVPSGAHSHAAFAFHGHYIVPGFIDVHVHGVEGTDTLDGGEAIATLADRLPRYGVTAFCPTTVACHPAALTRMLNQVREARETPSQGGARVLPAHLESNFINPEYRGAQPLGCLRSPAGLMFERLLHTTTARHTQVETDDYTAADILAAIDRSAPDVGIVTVAPELEGGLDLIRWLASRGHRVSMGHSGATYDEACAAIAAGARHATHLFNRMPPLGHRSPGLAGAVLHSDEVAAEIVCDAYHVHPAMVRTAIAAKHPSRVMAITDGTAASGLPEGSRVRLGDQTITAGPLAAHLDDGTIAGSVLTMERAFQVLVGKVGLSLPDAAMLCSTTPARELGLIGHGMIVEDGVADLVVLDAQLSVVQTYVGGHLAYSRRSS